MQWQLKDAYNILNGLGYIHGVKQEKKENVKKYLFDSNSHILIKYVV